MNFYIFLLRWVILFLNTTLVYSEVTDPQIRKQLKSPDVAVERGWVIQNKGQNIKTVTTSLTVLRLFPMAFLPRILPLTSKKSQHRGGPEDKVQSLNQTHDKRLKGGWSKTQHKSASPWLALAHGPKIVVRTERSLWSDWKLPCPDEFSGQREI